jgi:hypothetical protein
MTAITADDEAGPPIQIGGIVSSSFRVMFRRALDLLLLASPFVLLPSVLAGLLPRDLRVLGLALGLPSLLFVGGATLITYRELAGEKRLSFGKVVGQAAPRFGTLWGLAIIRNLCVCVGLLALVVPGLFLLAAWMPATAIAMAENKGATESLDLAWRLTKGSRWRLAALMAVQVGMLLLALLLFVVGAVLLTLTLGQDAGESAAQVTLYPAFQAVVEIVLTVTSTAAYVALRTSKQGVAGDVAEVFA